MEEMEEFVMSGKTLCEDSLNPVIRLFKNEFPNDVWITYCDLLGIDEETANKIISVEIEASRVLPQIH